MWLQDSRRHHGLEHDLRHPVCLHFLGVIDHHHCLCVWCEVRLIKFLEISVMSHGTLISISWSTFNASRPLETPSDHQYTPVSRPHRSCPFPFASDLDVYCPSPRPSPDTQINVRNPFGVSELCPFKSVILGPRSPFIWPPPFRSILSQSCRVLFHK